MKKQNEILKMSIEELRVQNFMLSDQISSIKRSRTLERIVTYLGCAMIILILLLWRCDEKKMYEKTIASLEQENDSLKRQNDLLRKENYELKNRKPVPIVEEAVVNGKSGKIVTAVIALSGLDTIFIPDKFIPYKVEVPAECPDCPKLPVEVPDTVSEKIVRKELNFDVNKIFSCEGTEVSTNIFSHSAPLTFSTETGFSPDVASGFYPYLNESRDSVKIFWNSEISGNEILLRIWETSSVGEETLFEERKTFPLGNAGYSLMNDMNYLEFKKTINIKESVFDFQKFKKGNREIIAGSILAGAGSFGTWYYSTHPIVEINVYNKGNLIGTDVTYNVPMIVVSGAGIVGGTILIIKGFKDRKASCQILPSGITFIYKINN